MKLREAREASLPAPLETLLTFADLSVVGGRGPGAVAYGDDRAAWLAARREWEARQGMTIAQWSDATWEELRRRAGSLDELSEAFALTLYEEDDWADPRA